MPITKINPSPNWLHNYPAKLQFLVLALLCLLSYSCMSITPISHSSKLVIQSSTIDFGSVTVGSFASQRVTLFNPGLRPIQITNSTVTGIGFSTSGLAAPMALEGGHRIDFTVRFTPTTATAVSGTVLLAVPLTNSPVTVALSGRGVTQAATPRIGVSPTTVGFTRGNVGDVNSQIVTLVNTGTSTVLITQAAVTGRGFSIAGLPLPLPLAPGRNYGFDVRFVALAPGTAIGSVTLVTDTPASPVTIELTGDVMPAAVSVSDVTVELLSSSSVTLTWVTDQPSDSQIGYGPARGSMNHSVRQPALVTSHRATINDLSAMTLYHFQVSSRTPFGVETVSPDSTFTTTPPPGAAYYVDASNGNDNSSGTSPGNAWKTIAKINSSTFAPGTHIFFIRGGVWRDQLIIHSSGTVDNYIVFDAYGSGPKPVISAADLVVNWASEGAKLWSAQVSWSPNQVFRNHSRLVKVGSITALTADNQWFWNGSGRLYLSSATNPNNTEIEVSRHDHAFWLSDSDHVALHNMVLQYCNSVGGCYYASTTADRSGFTVSEVDILYSYGPAISFNNTHGAFNSITIRNVTTDHCAILGGMGSIAFGLFTGGPPFSNINMVGGHFAYAGIHGDPSVPSRASMGVYLDNVQNSQFYDGTYDHNGSSALGIQNNSYNVLVSGGVMHDDGQADSGDGNELDIGGIGAGSSNISFTGIDLYGSRRSIIEIATTNTNEVMHGITITNCRIHGGLSHGVQIGGGHTAVVLKYNQIYANAGYGLLTNEGVSGDPAVSIYGNVVWGNGTGGVYQDGVYINSHGIRFKNNIVSESRGQEIVMGPDDLTFISDHNLFHHGSEETFMTWNGSISGLRSWQLRSGQDLHSIDADPRFLDTIKADFRLGSSSPAIYKGTDLGPDFKLALDPRTNFPYGTLDQDAVNPAWTIGAFAYF